MATKEAGRHPTVRELLQHKKALAEKNRKAFDRAWRKAGTDEKQLFRLCAERIRASILAVNPGMRKDFDLCKSNGCGAKPKPVVDGAAALLKIAGYDVSVAKNGRGRKTEYRIIYHHDPDA